MVTNIFKIKSKLIFDPKDYTKKHISQSSWKKILIAKIDDDLCEYYSWFMFKHYHLKVNPPLRKSHLTIVNDRINDIKNWNLVKKEYNNKYITIFYNHDIRTNGKHWWLRSDSIDARNIRNKLNLNEIPFFNYHITIGHANEKNIEHSEYILRCIKKYEMGNNFNREDFYKEILSLNK